tara:strand:+ start:461 stop:685 length:225 start_codon:yes stop_codon:yes gene_type:complete
MTNIIKTFIAVVKNSMGPDQKILLGRWNTIYTSSKINTRVDLSNEDHCGPCGQYVLEKKNEKEKKDIGKIFEKL